MFDVNDLKQAMDSVDESLLDRIETVHFDNHQFTSRCSENFINAYRGSKADVPSPAVFWLLTLRPSEWTSAKNLARYVESSVCRPISASEYQAVIDRYTETLLEDVPEFLQRSGGLLRAQLVRDDWDDQAVIGESADEFVVFHWETTA